MRQYSRGIAVHGIQRGRSVISHVRSGRLLERRLRTNQRISLRALDSPRRYLRIEAVLRFVISVHKVRILRRWEPIDGGVLWCVTKFSQKEAFWV